MEDLKERILQARVRAANLSGSYSDHLFDGDLIKQVYKPVRRMLTMARLLSGLNGSLVYTGWSVGFGWI